MNFRSIALVIFAAQLLPLTFVSRAAAQPAEELLVGRSMSEAVELLSGRLAENANDQSARFALGMAQALRAMEKAAGAMHEHGLLETSVSRSLPVFRLPVPANPAPKATSAGDVDRILIELSDGLSASAATLEGVSDPNVKLPVKVGMLRVDLNGDAPGGEMPAWELLARIGGLPPVDDEFRAAAEEFVIAFDLGDAHWLRGYCNLIAGITDVLAAHDKSELHQRVGHLLFARVDAPQYAFLSNGQRVFEVSDGVDAVDVIAFVHLINFPVRDAERLKSARSKFLATLDCSEKSWAAILEETDDDREWIPNPNQATVLPGIRVDREVIDAWLAFVADGRDVLEGRRLVPFWRGTGGQGVNFKRVFEEPTPLDLVLWVQGTAAAPYLERGPLADARTLRQLERLLGGQLFLFAVWVN